MKNVVRIDGNAVEPIDADIVETEPNVYSVVTAGASFEARLTGDEIAIGAARVRFEIEDLRQWKGARHALGAHERASLTAAMPGKIVRVLVGVGDEVSGGQGLIVIEAMKMQNELKSPCAGRVTSIEVKANDSVTAGQLLATIGQEP